VTSAQALGLYLDALFGAEPAGGLIEVRYKLRGRGGMGQMWHAVEGRRSIIETVLRIGEGTDAYIGVAPRRHRRGGRGAVEHVHTLWADLDGPEAVEALRRFRPLPAFVLQSGTAGHLHAYWPLWPPVGPDEAERANRRLAHHLGADARSTDAARILRPPGTSNHKHDPPAAVEPLRMAVELFELEQVVGDLADPTPAPTPRRPANRLRKPPGDDALLELAPAVYIEALTGREVGRDGKVACPFHEDRTPSLHAYPTAERGWCCHAGCGGGSIVDFGGRLYGLEPRGAGYHEIRERLERDLRAAARGAA